MFIILLIFQTLGLMKYSIDFESESSSLMKLLSLVSWRIHKYSYWIQKMFDNYAIKWTYEMLLNTINLKMGIYLIWFRILKVCFYHTSFSNTQCKTNNNTHKTEDLEIMQSCHLTIKTNLAQFLHTHFQVFLMNDE